MKALEVTLSYFEIKNGVARAATGSTHLGSKTPLELLQLLMIFEDISPIQSFVAEPIIKISVRKGGSFLVRTDLHKLILSNIRTPHLPSRVLEAASILLEIEDEGNQVRNKLRQQLDHSSVARDTLTGLEGQPSIRERLARSWPSLLCVLGAASLLVVALLTARDPVKAEPEWRSASAEVLGLGQSLPGTYITGTNQGDFAIVVNAPDEIVFVQMGSTPTPQFRTSFQLGRLNGRACLRAPDYLPIYPSKDSLQMGNLVFRRQ